MAKLSEKLSRLPVRRIYQGKKILPLGPWRPDLPAFANPGLVTCKNVIPHFENYKAFPGSNVASSALDNICQGAASFQDDSANTQIYAGDSTKLYRLVDTVPTDASSTTYSTAADEAWEFTRFNNTVVATNLADPVQSLTMGGTTFADLFTSTLKPTCRHLDTVLGRFLVLGNTVESGTDHPRRVRWSAVDDSTDMDASTNTLAGFSDRRGRGGEVQRVVGGRDYGVIFQRHAISRMEFVGLPEIWNFDEVEVNKGAYTPGSVISLGRFVFYLDDEGFQLFDGIQSTAIGEGKVDLDFFDQVDESVLYKISGDVWPEHSLAVWSYQSTGAPLGIPDLLLLYHWPSGEWAEVEVNTEFVFNTVSFGYTLETLDNVSTDIDALAFSLDSRVWTGGSPLFASFDSSNRLAYFNGTDASSVRTALLETGEKQLYPASKATIKSIRPLGEGVSSSATIEVGARNRHIDSNAFGATITVNANGEHTARGQNTRARYHRFRYSGKFTELQGLEIEASESGGGQ